MIFTNKLIPISPSTRKFYCKRWLSWKQLTILIWKHTYVIIHDYLICVKVQCFWYVSRTVRMILNVQCIIYLLHFFTSIYAESQHYDLVFSIIKLTMLDSMNSDMYLTQIKRKISAENKVTKVVVQLVLL